jgi:endonuclease/exonuclease/phosphatase family metal-dependent hydrolase
MMRSARPSVVICLFVAWLGLLAPAGASAGDLRVMSFNIRYGTAKDGENSWPLRRELLFKTIEAFDPDLLGLQECIPDQGAELRTRFGKTHDFIGVPRNDGKASGEMAAVMFRRERFEKVRDGTFWLSATPEAVGSKGWDAELPRVVTWVELKDRRADGRGVFLFNTHFDHKGRRARVESAKLLRQRIVELAGDAAVVVTGDFNVPESSEPQKELLAGGLLFDTFADVSKTPTTQDFTFHGFTGQNTRAQRIDWVLRSDDFSTAEAQIDRFHGEDGRYPSDHFPVTAVLKWSEAVKR